MRSGGFVKTNTVHVALGSRAAFCPLGLRIALLEAAIIRSARSSLAAMEIVSIVMTPDQSRGLLVTSEGPDCRPWAAAQRRPAHSRAGGQHRSGVAMGPLSAGYFGGHSMAPGKQRRSTADRVTMPFAGVRPRRSLSGRMSFATPDLTPVVCLSGLDDGTAQEPPALPS